MALFWLRAVLWVEKPFYDDLNYESGYFLHQWHQKYNYDESASVWKDINGKHFVRKGWKAVLKFVRKMARLVQNGEKTKLSETYFAKTFNWTNWAI